MATYGDMQTRIADELNRSDITSQIRRAILGAVTLYERRRFYFTVTSFSFSTVAGQWIYTTADNASIATSPNIEKLNALISATRTQMDKKPWQELDSRILNTTSRASPSEWAYRGQSLYLYPVPDAVYVITAYNTPRLTALSAGTDTNVWTNEAEELIRTRAKIDLLRNVIRGPEVAGELAFLMQQEREALTALFEEGASREATGYSEPTRF